MKFELNQSLQSLTKPPVTKDHLKAYALASGDTNPIHLEDSFAEAAGFPSVIVHGMLSMAYLGDCLELNFPQDRFELKKFACRFKKVTFPGDVLTSAGKVKKIDPEGQIFVSLWTENQSGEHTLEGEAVVRPKD
jgi:acyl dehydratase